GSSEEKEFFKAASLLAAIPGVENFESLKQVSKKNNYDFGLSMEFASQQLYDNYNTHPAHVQFIQQFWISMVADFMEIDYELLNV
ncbi:MAG: Dabb family protein, partial [Bacteroidota bacterium]